MNKIIHFPYRILFWPKTIMRSQQCIICDWCYSYYLYWRTVLLFKVYTSNFRARLNNSSAGSLFLIKVISVVPGCPSGTYFSGVSNCTLCPKDTYNNIDNHYMTKCTSCQEGHQTEGVGSIALTQCVCE